MRLFIAVQVPEELRGKLGALSKEIEQEGIRPVKPEKMHITLRFIGEYPEDKVGEIEEMLKSVRFKGFDCSLKGVGVFPNEDYIRVVWAGIESGGALVVPIRGRETEAGVIWLLVDGASLDEGLMGRARLVAGHAELALHNAERYYHAKERAFIDDVTEVYNARFLLQAAQHEIQRAERYEKELCVLFLDLDRFKLVNDNHGHLVGSEVLRRLSRVLRDCIRQVDTLARYGGDEFTMLLVDTDIDEGMAVAERIRRTVAEAIFGCAAR